MKFTVLLKILIAFLSLFSIYQTNAQDNVEMDKNYEQDYFINPTQNKIVLSGSFGELRSNHFHAGIDIKPIQHGKSGEPILASADGYISRIKIERGGYGRALYIDHPNGYTTVYAHMIRFTDSLEQYLEKMQYELQSFEVDIYLQAEEMIVKQGQKIGQMGSTGRSFGAHLHFEIRETKSEIPINPMLFGIKPQDHKFPMINYLAIHSLTPDMVINNKYQFQTSNDGRGNYKLKSNMLTIPAWTVGIAVHSFDKMDNAYNTNGIFSLMMYVDDSLYYGFTMDEISFDETNQINAHIDYEYKIKKKRTYQRCYRLPGNTLSIYENDTRGTIKLFKSKPRKIKIVIKDIEENASVLQFSIKRDTTMTAPQSRDFNFIVNHGRRDTINFEPVTAYFKSKSVYNKTYINCKSNLDHSFSIGSKYIPLSESIMLEISDLPNDNLSNKRCIVLLDGDKKISFGGDWDGLKLKANIRQLGTFKVVVDTLKPSIKVIKFPDKLSNHQIIEFKVKDNLDTKLNAKPIKIDVYIDGNWYLHQYSSATEIVKIKFDNTLAVGKHSFLLRAEDDRGNVNNYNKEFTLR